MFVPDAYSDAVEDFEVIIESLLRFRDTVLLPQISAREAASLFDKAESEALAFVMCGAILVAAPAFTFVRRMDSLVFAVRFEIPTPRDVDARLLSGAATFGIGWGLVGLRPGPAIAAIGFGSGPALRFAAAMAAGMLLFHVTLDPRRVGGGIGRRPVRRRMARLPRT